MRIAIFDSGVGGITVLKELHTRFPGHEFFYYGDTANVPYGPKSQTQIKSLVQAAATEIKKRDIDTMIIACNTAACIALEECREIMGSIPVYSVVEAGIATIVQLLETEFTSNVLILGTKATVRSKTYSTALNEVHGARLNVHEQECPLLVPMIEEGWIDHPVLHQTVQEYVKPYQALAPGIVFLACTHYPWIKNAVEKAMPNWKVIDSAALVGEMLAHHPHGTNTAVSRIEWHFTDQHSVPAFALAKTALER